MVSWLKAALSGPLPESCLSALSTVPLGDPEAEAPVGATVVTTTW
jgi:hypothetical protein